MQDDNVAPATLPADTAGDAADNQNAIVIPAVTVDTTVVPTDKTADTTQDDNSAKEDQTVKADDSKSADVPTFKVGREVFDDPSKVAEFANKMYGNFGNLVGALKRMNPNLTDLDIEKIKTSGQVPGFQDTGITSVSAIPPQARQALKDIGYDDDKQVEAIASAVDIIARAKGYVKNTDPWINPDTRSDYEAASKFFEGNPDALPFANAIGTIMDVAKASGKKITIEEAHKAVQSAINPDTTPAPANLPGAPKEANGMSGNNAAAVPAPTRAAGQVSDGVSELINLQ